MRISILAFMCIGAGALAQTAQNKVAVPATASIWLAGAPDGTRVIRGYSSRDQAPANSPVQATAINLTAGALMTFSATGTTGNGDFPSDAPKRTDIPPGGYVDLGKASFISTGLLNVNLANGIGDISAPINSLVGVFISDQSPSSLGPIPPQSNYPSQQSVDAMQKPLLRQPFFIGSGMTAAGLPWQIYVPLGATRLYFGVSGQENFSNTGSLDVTYTLSPSPIASNGTITTINTSSRVFVGSGQNVTITGIATRGTGAKSYLVRAIGPTLASFGVTGVLPSPRIMVFNDAGVQVADVSGWNPSLASTFSAVGAFALPVGSGDAAFVIKLAEGNYTFVVSSTGGSGVALVEVYDLP